MVAKEKSHRDERRGTKREESSMVSRILLQYHFQEN